MTLTRENNCPKCVGWDIDTKYCRGFSKSRDEYNKLVKKNNDKNDAENLENDKRWITISLKFHKHDYLDNCDHIGEHLHHTCSCGYYWETECFGKESPQ